MVGAPDPMNPRIVALCGPLEGSVFPITESEDLIIGRYEAAKSTVQDAFLEINASINQIRDTDEIQQRVLQLIFQVVPAECVAILLAGHDQDRFISTKYARAGSGNDAPFPIDQTIIKKALTEGARVYGEKVVCCPLTTSNAKVGVIYATMPKDGFEWFLAPRMQLFASIAGLTAVALEHARYVEWLERQNHHLKEVVNVEHGMVGHSKRQSQIDEFISRAGPSDRPVLILGETGTGKELVARAIHRNSLRANTELVAVNCGAFSENLLESELFGHEKGAFTGATLSEEDCLN